MSKEHKIKRIIKKYLETNKVYKRNFNDKIRQARSSRQSHSVKASISQKSRENTNLLLSSQYDRRENRTRRRNVRIV